jgi:hypothetical protein
MHLKFNQRYCYPLTVTDHASRYLLLCEAMESNAEKTALTAFERLFKERGCGNVGAAFLNWNCNAPGGPASCPVNPVTGAATGDFGISSSTGTFAQYNGTFGFATDINQATAPLNTAFSIPDFITFALNGNDIGALSTTPVHSGISRTRFAGTASNQRGLHSARKP